MKVPSKRRLVFICFTVAISVLVALLIAKNSFTGETYFEKVGKIKGITFYDPSAVSEVSGAYVSPAVTIIRFDDGDALYIHGIHDLQIGGSYRIVYKEGGTFDPRGGAEWGGEFYTAIAIEKVKDE